MYLALLFPSAMALYAIGTKKLTFPGTLLAWLVGFIIIHYGGNVAFGAAVITIGLIIVSDKIKRTDKDGTRSIFSIISKLLPSAICIVLYAITKTNCFYIMYYAVIASSLSDTLSSGIGNLSKKPPINIFNFKKLEVGESGGVSLLGLVAALAGGMIIATVYLLKNVNLLHFLLISLLGFMGSLIDTVLGMLFQGRYECSLCKKKVETKTHCQKHTKLVKGYALVDNNVVNLLNGMIILVISYFLFM